jgi:hypothetical protein
VKVGDLVRHKEYFGVGLIVDIRTIPAGRQWKIHWIRDGISRWAYLDWDLEDKSVEVISESR